MAADTLNFCTFACTIVDGMPHLATNIVKHFDVSAVAGCLHASKAFRTFVIKTLQSNPRLPINNGLENALAKFAITSGRLHIKQHGPIESGKTRFGFAFNNQLWIWVRASQDHCQMCDSNCYGNKFILSIYNLRSNSKVLETPMTHHSRPRVRIHQNCTVFIQDEEHIYMYKFKQDTYKLSSKRALNNGRRECLDPCLGYDSIYSCKFDNGPEGWWKITVCEEFGYLTREGALRSFPVAINPRKVLQKVSNQNSLRKTLSTS